jgi:hypothetical protein
VKGQYLDIVRMVLDRQLIDAADVECGKVSDVELEGGAGELRIIAVLTGPGGDNKQLPRVVQSLAQKIFGGRVRQVPWQEMHTISSRIKLRSHADTLGLFEAEKPFARWLSKLPLSR